MLKEQLRMLGRVEQLPPPPVLSVEDLHDKRDRTLLYGYTCDRQTHHVYIKDNSILVALYDGIDSTKLVPVAVTCNQDYVPNKRVYPTRSDFEFCALLLRHGVEIKFTEFDAKEATRFVDGTTYYGKLLPETMESFKRTIESLSTQDLRSGMYYIAPRPYAEGNFTLSQSETEALRVMSHVMFHATDVGENDIAEYVVTEDHGKTWKRVGLMAARFA